MKNKYLTELPRAIFISIIIFIILLVIEISTGQLKFEKPYDFLFIITHILSTRFFYTIAYTFALHFANVILFDYLNKIFATKSYTKKRLLVGFIASFFITIGVIFLLRIFEEVVVRGKTFFIFLQTEKVANYITASIITFVVVLIIHLIYFYKALQEQKLQEQKVIAGTASAKFESLKNQIDPHFLFNSLNVLSSLIEENPENAQKFTTSLSKVYRYVLEQKDKELISVEEELSFAETYMNLLKMRFENSLSYTIQIEPTAAITEMKVVPLSLQLLLENTVKHNIASEQKPLQIRIYLEANYLCIQNDLQKKEVFTERQGVGLQNIINRYAIITKRNVLIEQTDHSFTVKIPILTKQISVMDTQNSYSENTAYYRAKKRVDELKGFYGNLTSYCVVIPILIFINLTSSPKFLWFFFPLLGWGLGLTFHGLSVYGYAKSWEERKIKQLMNNNKSSNNQYL